MHDTAKPQENTWGLTVFLKQKDWECPARSLQYTSYSFLKNLTVQITFLHLAFMLFQWTRKGQARLFRI